MSQVNQQVIQILQSTIDNQLEISELDLEFRQINDLLPYMQYFGKLSSLKKLNLFGNRLRQLPINMETLHSVEQLDLANNLLDKYDIQMNIQSLKTIPNLKTLSYPVAKQKQQIIIDELKHLEILNNNKIIRKQTSTSLSSSLKQTHKELNKHYQKILQFQKTYMDQVDQQSAELFSQQNQQIINNALNQPNQSSMELTQQRVQYDLYNNLKKHALKICLDIFGDLGAFVQQISQKQDQIFQQVIKKSCVVAETKQKVQKKQNGYQNQNDLNGKNSTNTHNNLILEKQLKRLKKQKDQLSAEVNCLENQNKKYMDLIVKYSRGQKNVFHSLNLATNHAKNFITTINKSTDRPKVSLSSIPSHNVTSNFSTQNYHSSASRLVTLKQLKDTIEQIYESKLKFDQKNLDGKMPRETMQQYLYTYLNQKYGLKNLTIQNANNIISGIQTYSTEDNDVAVFGKILRNQIDQEFRNVQTQLKSTINNLLKMHIKSQHPYKSVTQIQQLFDSKINGEVNSQQVNDIVRYLYNKYDADAIMSKLQMLFKLNKPKQGHTNRRIISKEQQDHKSKLKLKFTVFLKTVLDFQLKNHEKLLKPLVDVFRLKDQDADGIISEDQFIYIIQQLCQESNEIIPQLLMIVDPYETKIITFTQIVKLVANYPENNPILSRFIKSQHTQE